MVEWGMMMSNYLEGYWQVIERLVCEAFGELSKYNLRDDVWFEMALSRAYKFLPVPVRLVVSKENFVIFCKEKKSVLVEASKKVALTNEHKSKRRPAMLGSSRAHVYKH